MKKSAVIMAALAASMLPFNAYAAEESVNVHVRIEQNGTKLSENITVTDVDGDGTLTIEDAIIIAHNQYYPGGAAAGYRRGEEGPYYIWGLGGTYNFFNKNNDENDAELQRIVLKDGDSLEWYLEIADEDICYVYSDYIANRPVEEPIPSGTEIDVSVLHQIPSEPEPVPMKNAELTVNGKKTGVKTGADGKAVLKLDTTGRLEIGAVTADGAETFFTYRVDVVKADWQIPVHVIIKTSNAADGTVFDSTVIVPDDDENGEITAYDALKAVHERYYPGIGVTGLGQNMIWGRSGRFLCEVQDAAGKELFAEIAVSRASNDYSLGENFTVTFRPEKALDDMYKLVWSCDSGDGSVYFDHTGYEISMFAQHWLPDSTDGEAICNAEVFIDGKATGIFTDENGEARVPMNETGSHTVTVRANGIADDAFNPLFFDIGEGSGDVQAAPAAASPAAKSDAVIKENAKLEPVRVTAEQVEPVEKTAAAAPVKEESASASVQSQITRIPSNAPAAGSQAAVTQKNTASVTGAKTGDSTPNLLMALAGIALAAFAGSLFFLIRKLR